MKFENWFNKHLKEYKQDIANNGADQGYPEISYYSDTTKLYNRFKDDIWSMLQDCSSDMGYKNTFELISTFNRKDMVEDYLNTGKLDDQAKCLLVWFACEELARRDEV